MKTITKTALSASVVIGLIAQASAATIGAGTGILVLAGANNTFDTPSDGSTDQSRQNLDDTFTSTLAAGVYTATTWTFQTGQTGSVIPYLAKLTATDTYEILGVGDQVDVTTVAGADETVPFGGSNTFTLTESTEIFAGIQNPREAGSQNPILTNLASGATVDHDNNADGLLSPAVVGGTVDGFGHANLARSYAFSIEVDRVPEPSTGLLSLLGVFGLALLRVRRR